MLSTTSGILKRCVETSVLRFKHTLPDLKYDFNALEPYISADIMKLHYEKHHQAYINNLNVTEEKLAEAVSKGDINAIINLQPALKFNGGGHINHTIFWTNLSPKGGGEPAGDLMQQIREDFTSFDQMKKQLAASSVGIQGSGWGWLGYNPATGKLQIATCGNQDPLQATTGLVPLFGIDVWEHAYYLQYKNVRADYVNAIFNIANWQDVSDRLAKARLRS
ncbi:Superoxide dismutase [Mn], mitochondrial [Bulinus truncatus]|nr:Superoxide dismutase [Mn], mitochondrial [Bulinus truncatus]